MDLATIEMPVEAAQAKFEEYHAAVKDRHDVEDAQIAKGYKMLARGHRLVELSKTLRAGGVTTRRGPDDWRGSRGFYVLPKLALAWADQKNIWCTGITREGGMTFFWNEGMNPHATRRNVTCGEGTWDLQGIERAEIATGYRWRYWMAMVPLVPPALRPRSLGGYHVLWEADWRPRAPRAPRDPALLKHIGGDLYAVVAVWDLTGLERAVLAGRRVA